MPTKTTVSETFLNYTDRSLPEQILSLPDDKALEKLTWVLVGLNVTTAKKLLDGDIFDVKREPNQEPAATTKVKLKINVELVTNEKGTVTDVLISKMADNMAALVTTKCL